MHSSSLLDIDRQNELNSRERSILQAVVHNFILNAAPVGSRNLSKYLQEELKLSPASIRNAMADLEEMGFIVQPHTSAGRVPTDKGYRYYVDSLMNVEQLSTDELNSITGNIIAARQDTVLKDVSKVLGSLSHYLSIVRMPQILHSVVEKIELFRLASNRLLIVLTLSSDVVRTLSLEGEFELDNTNLEDIQRVLNERLCGRALSFIRENLAEVFKDTIAGAHDRHHALMRLFIDSAEKLFTSDVAPSGGTLHIAGAQNLFDYPEFGTAERFRTIIELMESEEVVVHLLDSTAPAEGKVSIVIGREIDSTVMEDYSLLTTQYRYSSADAVGTIGLIGPKRMNYSRMISIVQHVATALSQKS